MKRLAQQPSRHKHAHVHTCGCCDTDTDADEHAGGSGRVPRPAPGRRMAGLTGGGGLGRQLTCPAEWPRMERARCAPGSGDRSAHRSRCSEMLAAARASVLDCLARRCCELCHRPPPDQSVGGGCIAVFGASIQMRGCRFPGPNPNSMRSALFPRHCRSQDGAPFAVQSLAIAFLNLLPLNPPGYSGRQHNLARVRSCLTRSDSPQCTAQPLARDLFTHILGS